jgi:hypothetical protein
MPGLDQVLADAFAILIGVFGVAFLGGFLVGRWTARRR